MEHNEHHQLFIHVMSMAYALGCANLKPVCLTTPESQVLHPVHTFRLNDDLLRNMLHSPNAIRHFELSPMYEYGTYAHEHKFLHYEVGMGQISFTHHPEQFIEGCLNGGSELDATHLRAAFCEDLPFSQLYKCLSRDMQKELVNQWYLLKQAIDQFECTLRQIGALRLQWGFDMKPYSLKDIEEVLSV